MFGLEMLLPILAGGLGSLFGGGNSGTNQVPLSAEQKQMLDNMLRLQVNRTQFQNPLYEEATTLARALMPRSARPSRYTLGGVSGVGGATRPGVGGDATYIGDRVGGRGGRANPTEEALAALAGNIQSPMNLYREQMQRGGR